jgi:hypothetical protein
MPKDWDGKGGSENSCQPRDYPMREDDWIEFDAELERFFDLMEEKRPGSALELIERTRNKHAE